MTRKEYENEVREKIFDIKNEFNKKLLELQKELLAEFKEEEPSLDGWKVGDKYYSHDTTGNIIASRVDSTNNGSDINSTDTIRIKHGYAKHTEEEVKFQFERDAVFYELSKFAEPDDREWNDFNNHWYICWNCKKGEIGFDYKYNCRHNDIYFASREDAEKAIEAVGEERIKKYYLEVKE